VIKNTLNEAGTEEQKKNY